MAREEMDSERSSSLCTFRIRGILYVVRWVGRGGSWGQRTDSGPFPAESTQVRSEYREEKRDEEMSFFGGRERDSGLWGILTEEGEMMFIRCRFDME